jgi:Cdc6-like AAA superfamily ATPase
VRLFLWCVFLAVFTPPAGVLGWRLARRRGNGPSYLLLAGSLAWGFGMLVLLDTGDFFTWKHWLLALPLVPLAGPVVRGLQMFSHFLKPKNLQEQLAEEEARLAAEEARLGVQAARRGEMPAGTGWLTMGAKIQGDLLPEQLGLGYYQGWLQLAEPVLDQHIFLVGATGAGKSETIKRLIAEILAHTDRHIYFVDGKGDEQLSSDIRALAHHHGRGVAPVFKLGFDEPGAIYDGFRGQAGDIYNRLLALVGVQEMEGDSRYYADIIRSILQYVCKMPAGPPRSFDEVLARLDREVLEEAYRDDPARRARIAGIDRNDMQGLYYRLLPLVEDFEATVGSGGFALEDVSCALFSMRVQSVGDTARRFLDFLVEDLKDFVGKRQHHPAVLVIDEFGQFSNDNIISLLTLARSSRLGVILATQDTSSLKDMNTRQQVLANTRTKILMATDFPQEVGELAGTVYQVESSVQHEDGDVTGKGSARVQHTFKIDMNDAAKLPPGEAYVIRQRCAVKIKVRAIDPPPAIPPQAAERRAVKPPAATRKPPTETRKSPPKLPPASTAKPPAEKRRGPPVMPPAED